MRKIAANLIVTVSGKNLKNSYVTLDHDGMVMEVVETDGQIPEIAGLEYYSGVLIPGLISLESPNMAQTALLTFKLMNDAEQPHKQVYRKAWLNGIQAIGMNCDPQKASAPRPDLFAHHAFKKECLLPGSENFFTIIKNHTLNAAISLGIESICGSIEASKTPGILLVSGFNFKTNQLTADANIERLA